jgi:Ni,Fe-hydrogenase I cytochrome b subunit
MSRILFGMLVASMAATAYLFARFLKQVRDKKLLNDADIEALSRILLSGSGGAKDEWSAVMYMLGRKYFDLEDAAAIQAGDRARFSWFVMIVLMTCTGMALMVWGW